MKLNKLFAGLTLITPVVAITATTSCSNPITPVEPSKGSAEEYIKDRTFGIASIDASGSWKVCGTGWILSDATKNDFTDYNYYIATNWHVKLGFDEKPGIGIGYCCDGMAVNQYSLFQGGISWMPTTDFCFESSTDCAIDFYIAKVNFGTSSSIPSIAKTKLDKLNTSQKEKGYINKFGSLVSISNNYSNYSMYAGGYPGKNVSGQLAQKWCFESMKPNATSFHIKGEVYIGEGEHAGHPVNEDPRTIWDQSANYMHNTLFACEYDSFLKEYIPNNWSLTAGASGSMVIAKENDEWVVVGIYWGGWNAVDYFGNVYFIPAMSIFKSTDKNFVENYEK